MTVEDTESGRDLCDALAALVSAESAENMCKTVLQNCSQPAKVSA